MKLLGYCLGLLAAVGLDNGVVGFMGFRNPSSSALYRKKPLFMVEESKGLVPAGVFSHHACIQTANITAATSFYGLLGFEIERKFYAGDARAAWMTQPGTEKPFVLEIIEVPIGYWPEQTPRRAVDVGNIPIWVGLHHFAFEVSSFIDGKKAAGNSTYNLRDWMKDLNATSIEKIGQPLDVAQPPDLRPVGRDLLDVMFVYDTDGTLIEFWHNCTFILIENERKKNEAQQAAGSEG
mmetsp:Transcript_32953/g.50411  ORF Transcript_32953/g.50411 Transcript_32953/m.50411 type:complete len:236 (-) Transcript_32953:113-820(-)